MKKKDRDIDLDLPILTTTNRSSGKGFLIFLIIVLLLCCLGLGGYIVYTKFFVKEETYIEEDTSKALEQVQIDGSSLLEVEDIINTFEYAFNDSDSKYFGYIYNNKEITAKSFDKKAAIFACLYKDLKESNNVSYVANNTVKSRYRDIFGLGIDYKPSDISAGTGYDILYDTNTNYYSYQRIGNGGYFYPTYVTFNDSSVISNEQIEITKRVGYLEYTANHMNIDIYADSKKNDVVGAMSVTDGAFNPSELEGKFKSSLAKYKYTFVKEKDKFIFDSIVRIK